MIRFDSIDPTPNDNQLARLRVLLPGEERSGNDAQVRAQLLRSDQRAQAFDVDTPLVVTPAGEIHYQTSFASPEEQPQIQIARRLPRSESNLLEDSQPSLSPEQQQLLVASPWKFIEQAAQSEEVGWENCVQLFDTLSTREKYVAYRRKLQRMLLSDRQEEIEKAEAELMKLPANERCEYAFWLFRSSDDELVDLAFSLAESLHLGLDQFLKMTEKMGGNKPLIRPPQLLLEVAQENPDVIPSPDFFERYTEMVDKGKRGGRYELVKPSRFETLIRKVVEPLGEMRVNMQTWNSMMRRVDEVIDVVRYGTETLQIDQPAAVEVILESLSAIFSKSGGKLESSTRTWDLLAKFVIPESLVPQTLEMMIQTGDTDHALAFFLLSRLPEDHPLLAEQREKAERLRTLCEGDAGEVAARYEQIETAQEGLVSAFPDAIPNEKVGFDYEFLPQVAGLKVPYGMEIGLDGGLGMPELRCIPEEQILQYTQEWRQRQFGVWLWSKTANSREVSVHVHVDESENPFRQQTEQFVMALLFGNEYTDYHRNRQIHTHEIRSALAGYGQDNVKGFSDGLNFYSLAEFLVALKNAEYHLAGVNEKLPVELTGGEFSADRFFNICRFTPSPDARAAAFVCLHSHFGTRVNKVERTENITKDSADNDVFGYEKARSLDRILKYFANMMDKGNIELCFDYFYNAISWLEVYESDQEEITSTLTSLFDQLQAFFQRLPQADIEDEYHRYLWNICEVLTRFPMPTVDRVHYLLRLKNLLPPQHQFPMQKYFFETLTHADDLKDKELETIIEKMLEVFTHDRGETLRAFLTYLPKYSLSSSESRKALFEKVKPEIQALFDEQIDEDKLAELRQVREASFLKIAQSICETEEEFQEYFRVIARNISAQELIFLLQSCEYWFSQAIHQQIIGVIIESSFGYKAGEARLYSEEKFMGILLESCDSLVIDQPSLQSTIDLFFPEPMKLTQRRSQYDPLIERVVFWVKKLQLSHQDIFTYLRSKSITLASQFLQKWDQSQQQEKVVSVHTMGPLIQQLQSSDQWRKIAYP